MGTGGIGRRSFPQPGLLIDGDDLAAGVRAAVPVAGAAARERICRFEAPVFQVPGHERPGRGRRWRPQRGKARPW